MPYNYNYFKGIDRPIARQRQYRTYSRGFSTDKPYNYQRIYSSTSRSYIYGRRKEGGLNNQYTYASNQRDIQAQRDRAAKARLYYDRLRERDKKKTSVRPTERTTDQYQTPQKATKRKLFYDDDDIGYSRARRVLVERNPTLIDAYSTPLPPSP